jgi:hypothetical protein
MRNGDRDEERLGLATGFASDVRSVAWPPVVVFLVIAGLMFR